MTSMLVLIRLKTLSHLITITRKISTLLKPTSYVCNRIYKQQMYVHKFTYTNISYCPSMNIYNMKTKYQINLIEVTIVFSVWMLLCKNNRLLKFLMPSATTINLPISFPKYALYSIWPTFESLKWWSVIMAHFHLDTNYPTRCGRVFTDKH